MPRVTEEHRDAMKRRIQDAALACFARRGFTGASMSDIVNEAGLSAGAVYVYYSGKAELAMDVGRRILRARMVDLENLGSAEAFPPPKVAIPGLLRSLLEGNTFTSVVLQVWGEASHSPNFEAMVAEIFAEMRNRLEHYFSQYLQQSHGFDDGTARSMATEFVPSILAMMQGCVVQNAILGTEAGDRAIRGVKALFEAMEFRSAEPREH